MRIVIPASAIAPPVPRPPRVVDLARLFEECANGTCATCNRGLGALEKILANTVAAEIAAIWRAWGGPKIQRPVRPGTTSTNAHGDGDPPK